MRAVEEKDDRLALQGLDRVRTSLDQLLKVHGLLVPDGAAQFVDARRQTIAVLGRFSSEELRAQLVALTAGEKPVRALEPADQELENHLPLIEASGKCRSGAVGDKPLRRFRGDLESDAADRRF